MKKIILTSAVLVLAFAIIRCGSSSSTTTTSTSTAANSYPSGMTIASLTTDGAASASLSALGLQAATVDPNATFAAKNTAIETVIAAASSTACEVTLPSIAASVDPTCYGPTLDYCEHGDFTGTADLGDCDDADPQGSPNDTDGDGQLPSGDLGIWTSTEGGTEACTAAKINQLIEDAAANVDYTLLVAAAAVCVMKTDGTALPTTDAATVDITTSLNTAVQVNNANVTVTSAIIENLSDITDNDADSTVRDAYKYTLVMTDTVGGNSVTTTSYMKHMPTNADNTTFKGRIWAEVDGVGLAGDKEGIAITYEKASSSSLKYKMTGADYSQVTSPTIFDANGDLDVTGDWTGDFSMAIINMDPSTGLGNFSYGWSAGTGPTGSAENARIFNGYTTSTGGCGFYGYGLGFDNEAGTLSDNVIDGMICNWAGPNHDHSLASATTGLGLAQKQCMTADANGIFAVDSATEAISYAPVDTCQDSSGMTVRTGTDAFVAVTTAHSLVTLASDTDFETYSAPEAPSLPTGL